MTEFKASDVMVVGSAPSIVVTATFVVSLAFAGNNVSAAIDRLPEWSAASLALSSPFRW
jgi:methylthioribose-1-phosphate isomerase